MTPSSIPDAEERLFVEAARTSYRRLKEWERQHPNATLGEIELKTREERRLLMGQLIPLLLADRRRDDPQARPRCPKCGKRMTLQDDGSVPVETLEGRITLERPYYYCRSCHEGFFPLDQSLHLVGQLSEGVQEQAVEEAACSPSFEQAAQHFSRLSGVPISDTTVHELTQLYGGRQVAHEAEAAQAAATPPARGVPGPGPHAIPAPERVAVSQDGTTILTRKGYKEVKVCSISLFELQKDHERGKKGAKQLTHHSYCAGLWDHETLNVHFWWDMQRRQADRSPCQVAVADAAPWIWGNFAITVPKGQEIIDWWHALDYLWRVANTLFGEKTAAGAAWMDKRETELWEGHLGTLRDALLAAQPTSNQGRTAVRCAVAYLSEHEKRLQYPAFRAAGFPLGSGTVESACNTLVGWRMKHRGQRWIDSGANAILAVRSAILSDRWLEAWPSIYWPRQKSGASS